MEKLTDNEIIKACGEVCTDNRFELISKYKNKLIEGTNIEAREDEMAVIDSILFRCWQMDWLDKLECYERQKAEIEEQDQAIINALKRMGEIRAEAIKEFAERLKSIYTLHDGLHMTIDNLVKEIVGE